MTYPISVGLFWSGGKDSAHALARLLADERYEVRLLLTTVYGEEAISSVHKVPLALMEFQAGATGIPLQAIRLAGPGLDDYLEAMQRTATELYENGIRAVAFGDLDIAEVRRYREDSFAPAGLEVLQPLSGMSSAECMEAFFVTGIEAITVVVHAAVLGEESLGISITPEFLESLPEQCDPSGELGEYHSFVVDAPFLRRRVDVHVGELSYTEQQIGTKDGPETFAYWHASLLGL